jgi:asparagine synthase (glutamine-hydrolysing)
MCGIAGIFDFSGEGASAEVIERMTQAIAHRGPDGSGHFIDGPIGLGHRRLSILDLSDAGKQPMTSHDGRWIISYNGEIYNFRELRRELEAAGVPFQSTTDTEVLVNAWAQWGEASLQRFNGMFAFAIWDRFEGVLYLCRDRYGIKPLYYWYNSATLLFGSEIKALLPHPAFKPELNRKGLIEYFTFQNFFTSQTLHCGVHILEAGNYLRVTRIGGVEPLHQYWDFHFEDPEDPPSEDECVEELDHLFRQAVKRQLVSDVPVGAYLSGGLDSGAISGIASQSISYLKNFTCGFDLHSVSGLEMAFDERESAEMMSYHFKTELYETVLKAGDMERCLPQLTWHLEEPRVGQSYPNYYVAGLASRFVKVALSGSGGDEIFAGYPWRYYRAVASNDFEHYIDQYYLYWQRLISNTEIRKVFNPIWNDVSDVWTRDIFRGVFHSHASQLTRPEDYINHSLYLEAKTFLHGLLVIEDKISMSYGLEQRVPFLDNDLVDFALRVPVRYKLRNIAEAARINENETAKGSKIFQRTRDGKMLLRRMLEGIVPEEIIHAVKQGFSGPDSSWFRGDSMDYVRDLLLTPNAQLWKYMDREVTSAMIQEHLEGRQNRRLLIWSLLNFEWWLRHFDHPQHA